MERQKEPFPQYVHVHARLHMGAYCVLVEGGNQECIITQEGFTISQVYNLPVR